MANPNFEVGSIKKRKQPGQAFTGADSVVPVEPIGHYNEIPPTMADGDFQPLQMDDLGNMKTSIGDPAQLIELKMGSVFPIPMGWKRQVDYDVRTDDQPVYIGFALMDTTNSDGLWYVFKFTYTSDAVTLTESAYGSWDGRLGLF